MPAGMLCCQKAILGPSRWVWTPAARRCAVHASPYGPAPITATVEVDMLLLSPFLVRRGEHRQRGQAPLFLGRRVVLLLARCVVDDLAAAVRAELRVVRRQEHEAEHPCSRALEHGPDRVRLLGMQRARPREHDRT